MSPYIIRCNCVSQDIWKKQWMSSTFTQMMVSEWHTYVECLCLPIEFSLEQSLHFCTMLALPLPPFRGALSWRIEKKTTQVNDDTPHAQNVPIGMDTPWLFLSLPLVSHTAIYPRPRHSFHTSATFQENGRNRKDEVSDWVKHTVIVRMQIQGCRVNPLSTQRAYLPNIT